jgi:hypothetical protein
MDFLTTDFSWRKSAATTLWELYREWFGGVNCTIRPPPDSGA